MSNVRGVGFAAWESMIWGDEDAQLLGRVPQVREPVRWYPGAFPCPPCRS